MMKALFVGGRYNGMTFDVEDLTVLEEFKGSYTEDWSFERSMGACGPRAELDNQPIIEGYLGPMWGGGKLRYETQEVYDLLSE